MTFLDGLFDFLNLDLTKSFDFKKCLASGRMDRLRKSKPVRYNRAEAGESIYSDGVVAVRLQLGDVGGADA